MPVRDLLSAASSQGGVSDPYFYDVSLLLNGDGTNGAQNNTFLDSSTNNFTITRNGNTTQGSFSPYGTLWSNYFNGSSSLVSPSNSAVSAWSTDFTVECWAFTTSLSASGTPIWTNSTSNSDGMTSTYVYSDGTVATGRVGVNEFASASGVWLNNTWNHIATVRSGSDVYIYVNGSRVATGTTTNLETSTTKQIAIGRTYQNTPIYLNGYVSNFRVVKGTALYTGTTYTVPTSPLTAITNTSYLTCQSNRFIDNSSNAFAITVNGTPSVQRFSPFNPTAPYDTSVIGGSGYFDGSGDYLTVPNNAAFDYGSGDFTLECWIFPTATNNSVLLTAQTSGSDFGPCNLFFSSGALQLYSSSNNSSFDVASGASVGTPPVGQWSHVAVSRNGTSILCFLNGVLTSTTTSSATLMNATGTFQIAARNGGLFYTGYVSNFRVVKGTAVYTSSFTPPTAPLTAISGTSLLTNMTNAGIPDLAMQNNLETVGSAQVSTSVKKYGTGSLAFDGSGDYLKSNPANSNLYAFGTGDFTIEMWAYFNAVNADQSLYDGRPTGTNGAYQHIYLEGATGKILYQANTSVQITATSALSASTWYHIALCRNGTSTKLFINGTQSGSTYTDSTNYTVDTGRPFIGINASNTSVFNLNGYIDDLRITNGYARYTANFTPPTSALPTY